MTDIWNQLSLESFEIGAIPVVRHFLNRLNLEKFFETFLPQTSKRDPELPHPKTLTLLIHHLLLERKAMYKLPVWLRRCVPEQFQLFHQEADLINDDRIGRALDRLGDASRASLLTAIIQHAVREFDVDLDQFHQDSTTVTFSGKYAHQAAELSSENPPPHITFGYNKDHRPDLKQLLFSLTISADGSVPIHGHIFDGNTSDDAIHIETWDFLRKLVGNPHFLYVADSKLATRENMNHISSRQGRFLSVLPRTRTEVGWFLNYLQTNPIEWEEVHRQENSHGKKYPDDVYHGVESTQKSSEGYRIFWFRSSQKQAEDQKRRTNAIDEFREEIKNLGSKVKHYPTREKAAKAAESILEEYRVSDYFRAEIKLVTHQSYRQKKPGRPTAETEYLQVREYEFQVKFVENVEGIRAAAKTDGLFPLITNDEKLTAKEALGKYKYQPFLEKRHQQLKTVFSVTPVWLKNSKRVGSLLWIYFVVQLVQSLIEREIRKSMKQKKLKKLKIYPEERPCEYPTSELVFEYLSQIRRHRLKDKDGNVVRVFHDPLTDTMKEVVNCLGLDPENYAADPSF